MRNPRIWVSRHMGKASALSGPRITERDLAEGVLWPHPLRWTIRIATDDSPYVVDVELSTDDEADIHVTGIAVRSGVPTSRSGTLQDPWLKGASFVEVSARDLQRVSFGDYVRTALAIVEQEDPKPGRRILEPVEVP
jgi:hypothetical protein